MPGSRGYSVVTYRPPTARPARPEGELSDPESQLDFPTKEALLEAVFVGRLRRLAEKAQALSASEDPGAAFFTFVTLVVDQAPTKNAFADALEEAGVKVQHATSEVGQHLRQALEALLGSAQQAGTVRDDIGVAELKALLVGGSRAVEHAGEDQEIRVRTLAVILDGLRPPG